METGFFWSYFNYVNLPYFPYNCNVMIIWRLIGRNVQVANTAALIALPAARPVQSVQQNFSNSNTDR